MYDSSLRGVMALITALSLVAPAWSAGATALAAAPADAGAPGDAGEVDGASVSILGLDTEETAAGVRLTKALRRAFSARGLGGGWDADLSELRTTLGCTSDEPSCLARGGEMLEAQRLIYGTLRKGEVGRWTLAMTILETESGTVAAQQTFELLGADLVPANVDATAALVVNQLLSPEPEMFPETDGVPPPSAVDEPRSTEGPRDRGDEGLIWGSYRPRPRWKWASFGVSVGFTLAGVAGLIGTGVYLTTPSGFRQELLVAAADTVPEGYEFEPSAVNDETYFNVVSPRLPDGISLCEYNAYDYSYDPSTGSYTRGSQLLTPQGTAGARDAGVGEVCSKGENIQSMQVGFAVFTAVSLVPTVVFTTLLFVHRGKKEPKARAWRDRGLRLGVVPSRRGGAALHLGGRF